MIVTVEKNHENVPFLAVVVKDFSDYVELFSIKNSQYDPINIIKVNKEDIREYHSYKKPPKKE
jgi:hypothetical protein